MAIEGVIVGLGNPGSEYAHTRHNCGFDVVSLLLDLVQQEGDLREQSGAKFSCELWQIKTAKLGGTWLVARPLTFMNLSGRSVQPLLAWHKIEPSKLIVIHDELDIPVGELRFKWGGGNAGHNGLKSISQELGTNDFYRLRVGIGRPVHKTDILNWVLGRPSLEDRPKLQAGQREALFVLEIFAKQGLESAVRSARKFKPTLM